MSKGSFVVAGILAAVFLAGWVALQGWVVMLLIAALPVAPTIGFWPSALISAALTVVEILFLMSRTEKDSRD